jgi:two-component system, LuxR family, response regulator FixJ
MSSPYTHMTVHIVDDDLALRDSLNFLLSSIRLTCKTHESGDALLAWLSAEANRKEASSGMVITDVRMPGVSGLELQAALVSRGITMPVIVLTGHADVSMAVRALKNGAFDFIEKPFRDQTLIDTVIRALATQNNQIRARQEVADVAARFALLSIREREVFQMVVVGMPNKQIASHLELSEKTVEIHRASVMRKMNSQSLPSLVRQAVILEQYAKGTPAHLAA